MVICLEQGADLHMAQLMPLPLTVSCFSKIQIGFTFLVPARLGSHGKGLLNGCVCVCRPHCSTAVLPCVCLSGCTVCWSQQWSLQKLLNWSWCLCALEWDQGTTYYVLARMHPGERAFGGFSGPSKNIVIARSSRTAIYNINIHTYRKH